MCIRVLLLTHTYTRRLLKLQCVNALQNHMFEEEGREGTVIFVCDWCTDGIQWHHEIVGDNSKVTNEDVG